MGSGNSGYLDPVEIPLSRPSDTVGVFRLTITEDLEEDPTWDMEPLPNVVPVTITIREGAHAPMATFRYVFDQDLMPPGLPTRFHQVYGDVKKAPGVVHIDDRLVVIRAMDDGTQHYLFDGFVTSPQARADGGGESGLIVAHGTPHREWDYVIPGAIHYREMGSTTDKKTLSFTTAPAWFNPNGKGNLCADGEEVKKETDDHVNLHYFKDIVLPGFVSMRADDHYTLYDANAAAYVQKDVRQWTIAQAAAYVVMTGIEFPLGLNDSKKLLRDAYNRENPFVSVYDINAWGEKLKAYVPKTPGKPIVIKKPETFEKKEVVCPSVEVTGDAWPNALEKLISPYGFRFRFDLRTSNATDWSKDMPEWLLTLYRTDYPKEKVQVYLQNPGDVYSPAQTNVAEVDVSRDAYHVGTEFEADTSLVEYEATFVLAPAFPLAAADKDDLPQWEGEHADPAKRHYYRRWVFGENGEKVWITGSMKQTTPVDELEKLETLFRCIYTEKDEANYKRQWAQAARAPLGRIFTPDKTGRPLFPRLAVTNMTKYLASKAAGPPALWQGSDSSDWQWVTGTHWRTLDDCIGIQLLTANPNAWHAGKPREGETIVFDENADGTLNLVEWMNSDDDDLRPVFALTCVIQSDVGIDAFAKARKSSVSKFPVRRKIDGKERWKRKVITKFSMVASDDPTMSLAFAGATNFLNVRDDTDDAKSVVQGYQRAHETGSHGGSFTIRRITTAYNVGQVVTGVVGRDIDMRINAQAPKEETPHYPRIQSITWNFDGDQTTTLHLTDERADPLARVTHLSLRPGRQK